jgi:2-oxo-4-hydroxy-4-carboxy-5-ureidoimidazoline decarboxylase
MTIAEFDHLPTEKKKKLLQQCCGSSAWVNKMLTVFPVEDLVELLEAAEEKWYECSEEDWKEAFEHHPKIGDINSLRQKYIATKTWAEGEQAGVTTASEEDIKDLEKSNNEYQKKFGYIFIVCATGKTAKEMIGILKTRLQNTSEEEVKIASAEQNKITKLRVGKLLA